MKFLYDGVAAIAEYSSSNVLLRRDVKGAVEALVEEQDRRLGVAQEKGDFRRRKAPV